MQQIPTLLLLDGTVMSESAAILIHLGMDVAAPGTLLPIDASKRAQTLCGLVTGKLLRIRSRKSHSWMAPRQVHLKERRPSFFALLQGIEQHETVAPVFARHWIAA